MCCLPSSPAPLPVHNQLPALSATLPRHPSSLFGEAQGLELGLSPASLAHETSGPRDQPLESPIHDLRRAQPARLLDRVGHKDRGLTPGKPSCTAHLLITRTRPLPLCPVPIPVSPSLIPMTRQPRGTGQAGGKLVPFCSAQLPRTPEWRDTSGRVESSVLLYPLWPRFPVSPVFCLSSLPT